MILDDFSFPDNGQTQYISYGQQELTKSQILTQRLQQFVQKGQELGMEVSLYLSNPTDNNGLNETLGTDTASFYEVVSHLYVPLSVQNKEGEAQLKQSVSALTQDADKLIPIYNDPQVFSTRFTQDGSTDFYCFDTVNNGYSLNGFYTD